MTNYMKDGIGFIEVLEVFGSDLTIVNAARVSMNKVSTELTEADRKLINYLAQHHHVSPFFHPQVRLRIKMPIFVAREYFRHTVGISRNEVSRRYVDDLPVCWFPAPEDIRERDPKIKQGSKSTPIAMASDASERIQEAIHKSVTTYMELLAMNVAPEIARSVLPVSTYTEFIETGSLAAYARICQLRNHPEAQVEIREYAQILEKVMSNAFPVAWLAMRAHRYE
jgi:thymidylate synthase (FAD)